jgi:uncharacterized protein (DUF433 family)
MARELNGYIVADPDICHGKLTFRGTRIMVDQVLEQVENGTPWWIITEEWGGRISEEAIQDAVRLARKVLREHAHEFLPETAVSEHSG